MKLKNKKEAVIRGVNEKYVDLLNKTFDKYKDIKVLEIKGEVPVENEEVETTLRPVITSYARQAGRKQRSGGGKSEQKKAKTLHKLYKCRLFTPEEDKIILKIMQSAENKTAGITELTKVLNRPRRIIYHRIDLLRTGTGIKGSRTFSLQEDFVIIDNALKNLKQCKSLVETQVHDHRNLARSLGRPRHSVYERWNTQMKMWLLQYYQKTLNLEIRPMLINVLADNFDSIQSIDWDWVQNIPEFSGYTSNGLKRVFISKIIKQISRKFEIERTEMTLNQLAEAARDFKFSKVNKSVLDRQRKIIEYFEKHVEMEGIRFREDGK